MLSVVEVRNQVQQLLSGVISQDDFEDRLVGASWNMHQHADQEVQKLVGAIELRLAEYSDGHLDDSDLHAELQMLMLYGCIIQPLQAVFVSVVSTEDHWVTLTSTVEDAPQMYRLRKAATSPVTTTGSARTFVFKPTPAHV